MCQRMSNLYNNKVMKMICKAYQTNVWNYIEHVHTINVFLVVSTSLQYEIKSMFKNMIGLKKRSINLFFTDIDKLKTLMLEELE